MEEPNSNIEIEKVAENLIKDDLAQYLLNSDAAKQLVNWAHEETGIKKVYLSIIFRIIAPLIIRAGKKTAGWGGGILYEKATKIAQLIPGYNRVSDWLSKLRQKLENKQYDKKLLHDIINGDRPPADFTLGRELSEELQLMLQGMDRNEKSHDEILSAIEEIKNVIRTQPPLGFPKLKGEGTGRLHFSAQKVPFVGRKSEIKKIEEFLYSKEKFSWWIITGSGGLGKSRLALEICRRNEGWRSGFLDSRRSFDLWDQWSPEFPTLVIVDYAAAKAESLRDIISSIQDRSDSLSWDVRFLLVEREASGKWWDDFIPSKREGLAIKEAQFADPLALAPLTEDDIWSTIHYILDRKKANIPNKEETINQIRQIDPELRPLYAALCAEALAIEGNIRGWEKTKLLDWILSREEREFWRPAGITEFDKSLLCFATMINGIPYSNSQSLGNIIPKSLFELGIKQFDKKRYEIISNQGNNETLMPLEPDIVGEYFVLRFLANDSSLADDFNSFAWNNYLPVYWEFLNKCGEDFPNNGCLFELVQIIPSKYPQNAVWATLCVNFINYYGIMGSMGDAVKIYNGLKKLADQYPDDQNISKQLAFGMFNLINHYGTIGGMDDAQKIYEELKELANKHPNNQGIRENLARGMVNLVNYYGEMGSIDEAKEICEELKELTNEYPDDQGIRKILAFCMVNLITDCAKIGNMNDARKIYKELKKLTDIYPDNQTIREAFAIGMVNLINHYGKNGRIDDCMELYDGLKELTDKYPKNQRLQEQIARGMLLICKAAANSKKREFLRKFILDNLNIYHLPEFQKTAQNILSKINNISLLDFLDSLLSD